GGDAVRLVSGSARAETELGWVPERSDLPTMIQDAWKWFQSQGYRG
ncbi:UDP-glucose 4-epimerase GalE, partial [Rhodovulum visakhapatnamense]|nr:UDP-glucose 4-epimerase GalE [Rhodovulum visakhapatnamense]MBL3579915.1 UDP-glucose 4-epimerase GalE [Rhodovulum visakhapatnamense]